MSILKLAFIQILLISFVFSQQEINCKNKYGSDQDGVCTTVEECTGAALTGNCKNPKQICCIEENVRIQIAEDKILTQSLFLKIAGNSTRNRAFYTYFVDSMKRANISVARDKYGEQPNIYRRAAFFSQLVGESDFFRKLESNKIDSDVDLSLGNNQPGDGSRYQARGAILLRGKSNYELAQKSIKDLDFDIVK